MSARKPQGQRSRGAAAAYGAGPQMVVGWIVGVEKGSPRVDFQGNPGGPVLARTTVKLEAEELLAAVAKRQGALLALEGGDPSHPILTGLIQSPSETPLLDEILGDSVERVVAEAKLDGKRVVLEGKDEIVLRCGEASITLRRNGKVVIRGTYLETRSAGINRIKGGKVEIN